MDGKYSGNVVEGGVEKLVELGKIWQNFWNIICSDLIECGPTSVQIMD